MATEPQVVSKKQVRRWRSGHRGKRRFTTRREAWAVIARMMWRHRELDFGLRPYTCRWGNEPMKGPTMAPHLHIGHKKRRPRRWLKKLVIWPYYRTRRRVRMWWHNA